MMNNDLAPEMDLVQQIFLLLREQPQGCSEYQLIQELKLRHSTHIPNRSLSDKLVLFRTHFLVFNALYLLRDQLWGEASGHLHISPLLIQLQPYTSASTGVSEQDPLREYYLDLTHLRETGESDVEELLDSFWARMRSDRSAYRGDVGVSEDEKLAALELFELDQSPDPLDLTIIKRRYRHLVSLHHPDRGGSTSRLQSINLAMEILERYY